MKVGAIYPGTRILEDCDVYILSDHMPPPDELLPNVNWAQSGREYKELFTGCNTYLSLFAQNNIDINEKFFVSNQYLSLNMPVGTKIVYTGHRDFIWQSWLMMQVNPVYRPTTTNKIKNFNAIMNKARPHRGILSHWLKNSNLLNYDYTQSWESNDGLRLLVKELMYQTDGDWQREITFLDRKWLGNGNSIDHFITSSKIANPEVFYHILSPLFEQSMISIVTEPHFFEHACALTEKYIFAVTGGTIPLLLNYGIYDVIDRIGLDGFTDIIDVTAQYEPDPVLRTLAMLDKNRHLLENALDLANSSDIQSRLWKNFELIRDFQQLGHNVIHGLNHKSTVDEFKKITVLDEYRHVDGYKEFLFV